MSGLWAALRRHPNLIICTYRGSGLDTYCNKSARIRRETMHMYRVLSQRTSLESRLCSEATYIAGAIDETEKADFGGKVFEFAETDKR